MSTQTAIVPVSRGLVPSRPASSDERPITIERLRRQRWRKRLFNRTHASNKKSDEYFIPEMQGTIKLYGLYSAHHVRYRGMLLFHSTEHKYELANFDRPLARAFTLSRCHQRSSNLHIRPCSGPITSISVVHQPTCNGLLC